MITPSLSKKDQEELTLDLINALVVCESRQQAALFLQDLLTMQEMKTLSKRLRIAKLLMEGMTYEEIEQILHVSHTTVAKISAWLAERGDGFRKTIEKMPTQRESLKEENYSEWDKLKRKHSLYFWPELLLEEVVKSANKKQKKQISNVLDRLEEKSDLHRKIESLLKLR